MEARSTPGKTLLAVPSDEFGMGGSSERLSETEVTA
jgi:hypothetical protein